MIIEYSDKLYPNKLRKIKNPPSRLYVLGNYKILNELSMSVVGSRKNTQYGEKMCKTFTKELVRYGFNIVSGLALGIDTIAHNECIKNSGKTIAVLPSGFNKIYPVENIPLIKKIINNEGAIISEYEENIGVDSSKFLERNRIVAGLGDGTLVIEAGYRSGTRVTARLTQEQGKPVFCISNSSENNKIMTINELIKKGAHLITKIDDILSFYAEI